MFTFSGAVNGIAGNYANCVFWADIRQPYSQEYINKFFKFDDNDGRGLYWTGDLTGNGTRRGETGLEWRGFNPTIKGRHWMHPPTVLDQLDNDKRIFWPKTLGAWPKLKRYLNEAKGIPLQDLFDDIYSLMTMGGSKNERLGYPTQKPEALLERIIRASSNEGDVVLDPFCGCGTAIAVAERLHRHWIGIDITHIAITLMRHRLSDAFRSELSSYEVIGDPKDLTSAEALAQVSRYQFEVWAVGLIDAMPGQDRKKGADSGIDGYKNFFDDNSGKAKKIIVQVKSGHVSVSQIRDLKGVLEREKAAIGAFVTLKKPTRDMIKEAVPAGFYEAIHYAGREYPRMQILTIEELLSGKKLLYPSLKEVTFKQAERKTKERDKQAALF